MLNWKQFHKCVSTILDECRGVGPEMSTGPKRKATNKKVEHIVSSDGNIGLKRVEQLTVMTSTDSVS